MTLSDEEFGRILGDSPVIAVDAPAGAGKTHLACTVAFASVPKLKPYQEVLFLSHTNAARDVFRRRVSGEGRASSGIALKTLDTFCIDVLSPYADLWGLPTPLRPPTPIPRDWFLDVRRKAATLFERRLEIARAAAHRYPLVLADEHQDASIHHNSIIQSLARVGSRVRMFGDALQAILTFDPTIPGWDHLTEGIATIELSGAWRWRDAPELGEWISAARALLKAGVAIPLSNAPVCVDVMSVLGTRQSWTQNADVLKVLRRLRGEESLIVLSRRNDEAKAIARHPELDLAVNEGSDQSAVEQVVAEVVSAIGDHRTIAGSLVDFMIGCGSLDPQSAQLIKALDRGNAEHGTAEVIDILRARADLPGLVLAVRAARRHASQLGWTISHPMSLNTLAALPLSVGVDEVRELIFQAQRAAAETAVPSRCASTIHKAKGREFDHVVVPWLDASTFGPDIKDRQLLYVALSRARRRLTLVVPAQNRSPLVSV